MSDLVPIDEVVYFDVITSNPTVAGTPVSDADSAPTFDVYEEATDTGMLGSQTMTKRTSLTGNYRGTFTASAANGFEAGKWYSAIASATVSAVAGKCVAKMFRCGPAEAQAGVPKVDVQYVAGATPPTVADTSAGVWDLARSGHATAGTFGEGVASVQGSVTGAVASVTGNVSGSVVGAVGSVTGSVGGSVAGSVGSVTGNVGGNVIGSVASVAAAVAITSNIKKNQALSKFSFLMTDSTLHAPATGKTVTCTRSIDGAGFATGTLGGSGTATEITQGMYYIDFASGDLNGNVITLRCTATLCDDTFAQLITQP